MEDAYSIIAAQHKYPNSARYHNLLETLLTPIQARLAVELPATAEELAERLGMALPEVVQKLDNLFYRGIIYLEERTSQFKMWGGPEFLFYCLCAFNRDTAEARQAFELWADFFRHDWSVQIAQIMAERQVPQERVLPAYKAVQDYADLQPCEDVREIMRAAEAIGIIDCPCRLMLHRCHGALDTCFVLNKMAKIFLSQGIAKRVTVEEAIALMEKAAEEGQVHTWINSSFMYHRYLCNCCNDCCITWAPLIEHGISVGQRLAKSRFQAEVDLSKCSGDCHVCVGRCLFHAMEMKQMPGWDKPKAVIDPEKCWGCGLCVLKCKPGALSLKLVRPLEHIPGLVPI